MNPLKFDFGNFCFNIMSLNFIHITCWASMSLDLHVTNHNGHHFTIGRIIYMTSHSCPTSHMLHMITHDPKVLQIPYKLHLCDKTHFIPHTIYQHLELDHLLSYNLSREVAFLDIVIVILGLQFKDAINITTPWMMFERSDKVTNVGKAQFTKLVLDVL